MTVDSQHTRAHHSLTYLPHVDGLRALAVALVVIYHAWPTVIPGGFIGVDVFFVISGFIITRQLAVEMETGTFSYAGFLGRRVRRLVPAVFVCSVIVTIAAVVLLMPDALEQYGRSLVAAWLMIANIHFYDESGYFDAPSQETPLLHIWSLAVEDQFYLAWPLLLIVLWRLFASRPRIATATLAIAALSLVHAERSVATDPNWAFYLLMPRAFELLAGCALALMLPFLKPATAAFRSVLDTVGLALVVGSALLLHSGSPFPGLAALPTVVGTVLLIGAGLQGPTPVSNLLARGPVVLVGKMSYSIYLYHWPVLALATSWLGRTPNAVEAAGLVALSLGFAALSWLLVEQWLTRRVGMFEMSPRALIGTALGASATISAFAVVMVAGNGWPERLDAPAFRVYEAASVGNPLRRACDGYDNAFSNRCTFGKPHPDGGGAYDIAVFGDSNADHFVPMIAALAKDAGLSGRQVTQSSCAPLIGIAFDRPRYLEDHCMPYQETMLAFLDRNPGLKLAVLSWAWHNYEGVPKTNGLAGRAGVESATTIPAFIEGTIGLLRQRGIKVLVIGQVPFFDTFSLPCFVDAARRDTEETDCTIPRAEVDAELAATEDMFKAMAAADPGVSFLDMSDVLCDAHHCSAFKDDVLIYRDRTHINAIGSAYLARYATLPKLDP